MRVRLINPWLYFCRSKAVRPVRTGGWLLALALFLSSPCLAGTSLWLTNTAAIRALTVEQASNQIPVLLTGIVTAAEADWAGRFFLQDASGGVWIDATNIPAPAPGDVVQVSGVSNPGGYSRNVIQPQWRKVGTAPLPEAKPISAERFASGVDDGLRVEVTGVVNMEKVDRGAITQR